MLRERSQTHTKYIVLYNLISMKFKKRSKLSYGDRRVKNGYFQGEGDYS